MRKKEALNFIKEKNGVIRYPLLFDIFQDNDEIPDYLFNSEFNDNSKNETELIYQLMNLI